MVMELGMMMMGYYKTTSNCQSPSRINIVIKKIFQMNKHFFLEMIITEPEQQGGFSIGENNLNKLNADVSVLLADSESEKTLRQG